MRRVHPLDRPRLSAQALVITTIELEHIRSTQVFATTEEISVIPDFQVKHSGIRLACITCLFIVAGMLLISVGVAAGLTIFPSPPLSPSSDIRYEKTSVTDDPVPILNTTDNDSFHHFIYPEVSYDLETDDERLLQTNTSLTNVNRVIVEDYFSRRFHYEMGFESLSIEKLWFDRQSSSSTCSTRMTIHQLHFYFSAHLTESIVTSMIPRLLSNSTVFQDPLRFVIDANNQSSISLHICFPPEESTEMTTSLIEIENQLIFAFSPSKK